MAMKDDKIVHTTTYRDKKGKRKFYDISGIAVDESGDGVGTIQAPTMKQRRQIVAEQDRRNLGIKSVEQTQKTLQNAENEFSQASKRYETALSNELQKTGLDYRTKFEDMSKKKISYQTKNEDKPKNQPTPIPIVETSKKIKKELEAKNKAEDKLRYAKYENNLAKVYDEKTTNVDRFLYPVRKVAGMFDNLGEVNAIYDENGNKTFLPSYTDLKNEKVRQDTSGLAGVAMDITGEGAKVLTSAGVDLLTGGIGGKALYWSDMAADNFKNVKNQGYDDTSAIANTLINTGSEFLTTKLLSGLAKPLTGAKTSELQNVFANAFTKATKNPRIANLLGSMTSEGLEEGVQELVGALNNSVTLGQDIDVDDLVQNALYSALVGAGTGGVVTGAMGNAEGKLAQKQLNAMNDNLTDLYNLKGTNSSRRVTNAIKAGEEFANKPFTTDFNKAMDKVSKLNEAERSALVDITQRRLRGEPLTQNDADTINYLSNRDNVQQTTQPVQEAPAQEVVEEKPRNVGVHYGDLGKANDTYYSNISKSRGTGHLGTGTYFVSEDYKPGESSTYAKRPANEVNFDGYNLYKPSTDQEGYDLHDGLKAINSKSLFNKEEVGNLQEKYNTYLKDSSEDSINDLVNTLDKQGYDVEDIKKDLETGWTTRAETNLKDMAEDIIDDYDRLYKSYNNMIEQIKKNNPNISDEAINKAFEETNKTLQNYNEKGYKYGQYPTPSVDSLSTVFMKNLGYEGVDVRHLKGLDDTTYGSVIYDLKNKEKETANIVRDTYKDIKNRNVKATIAPYYNTRLTKENYTTIRDAVDESFKSTANNIATLLGGKIKDTTNNIGGFTFDEGETAGSWVRELSYTFELENMSKEDAILFTSLMGDLGHEQQEAVIAATYEDDINNSNAVEFRLNYKNRDKLSKALDDLGIHDYTIDTNNKTLKLLEFDDLNNPVQTAKKIADIIEKLGGDLEDAEYSGIQSEYITKGTRERAYKTWLETNKRSEENRQLYSLVEQAYKKVEGSIAKEEGTSDSSFSNEKLPDKNVNFEDIQLNQSEDAKPVEVLGEMPKKEKLSITQKAKKYANAVKESGSFLRRKFVDKLQSIDMLDRENNRKNNLYAEADRMHRSVAEAQYSIGDEQIDTDGNEYKNFKDKKGKNVSKSLIGIFDEVEENGMNMQEFNEYLIDYLNLDRYDKVTEDGKTKAPRGLEHTKEMSQKNIDKFEKKHKQAKRIAENIWQYSYNELDNKVKTGVMTKQQADNFKKETPHYVPISRDVEGYQSAIQKVDNKLKVNNQNKKIKGDSRETILPIREAMAWNTVLNRSSQRINNAIKAVAQHYDAQDTGLSYSDSDLNINQDNVAVKSKDGKYYLTYFDDGKAKTFQVDKGMYEAFLPDQVYEWEKYFKIPAAIDSFRKKLITDYNVKFLKNNAIKDIQDAMINTQYPKEFLVKYGNVATRLKNGDPDGKMQQYINEFKKAGGFSETYFADREFTSQETKNPAKKALQMLNKANEYIELTPRLTEYILSREHGESVSVALHNAADVTTNFARGGVWAKKMNKWGFTFLNPSIQGADKAIRNLDPRNPRRFASVVARGALLGIACGALNEALWGDDDDYKNLNEYIKNNYYVIPDKNGKPSIRIPKGRMMSVLQSIGRRGYKTSKGDGNFIENFKDLPSYAWGQVGPADPGNNNVFAPLIQAARNKSWSGNPIDSEYEAKNVAPEERYSVKTTAMAKKLGKALNMSPKRLDYVFDQYSGAIGDFVIPMTNQYAETSSDNKFLEGLGAVFGNDMKVDPVFNNKQLGELYDNSSKYNTLTSDKKKNYKNAIGNKYLNEKIGEISEYNQQIKDIQASDKSNKEKMKETRDLQKKINEIAENANKTYKKVEKEGDYAAKVGNSVYAKDKYGKWKKESDKTKEKRDSLGLNIEDYYYYKKEEAFTKPDGNQTTLVDGEKAKDKISLVDAFGFDPSDYLEYSYEINKIKAGKDTKRQVTQYIESLPISEVQKAALYKKKYRSYRGYDKAIYDSIENSNLSLEEKESLASFLKIQ